MTFNGENNIFMLFAECSNAHTACLLNRVRRIDMLHTPAKVCVAHAYAYAQTSPTTPALGMYRALAYRVYTTMHAYVNRSSV